MRKFKHVFGIGPGKSGTHSLWQALETLGISCIHLGNDKHRNDGDARLAKIMLANRANSRPILQDVEESQAYVDYPINLMPEELDKQYPESLFVLTYRNPDDIALSWARMCHSMLRFDRLPDYHAKAAEAREMYHNAFKYFHGRPEHMLVLDTSVEGTSNMQKLSAFLETEAPTMDWPHAFNHRDWYKGRR